MSSYKLFNAFKQRLCKIPDSNLGSGPGVWNTAPLSTQVSTSESSVRARPELHKRSGALEIELAMAKPSYPVVETTSLVLDKHNRPITFYLGHGENWYWGK